MSYQKSEAQEKLNKIPSYLPEEAIPLYNWWKANSTQVLTTAGLVILVVGGSFAYRQYSQSKQTKANQALLEANSIEDAEALVAQYGSTKAGNAGRLRLAKLYFDAQKYEEALAAYDACISHGAPKGFQEIPELGRAQSLEALKRYDDALAAYRDFEKKHAGHYLQPQATLGVARVLTMQGNKEEALKLLELMKAEKTDATAWEMTIENLENVIKRYEPRAARSLFEMADEAAAATAQPAEGEEAKPVEVEVTPPVEAPAAQPAAE